MELVPLLTLIFTARMSSGIATKKHKKYKKHKSSHAEPHASEEGLSTPGIKLKIKFGGGQVSSEQRLVHLKLMVMVSFVIVYCTLVMVCIWGYACLFVHMHRY